MTVRPLRYSVPVDGQAHRFDVAGRIVNVAAHEVDAVNFWTLADANEEPRGRTFVVYATGQHVDDGWKYRGTALAGPLVWHLFEAV